MAEGDPNLSYRLTLCRGQPGTFTGTQSVAEKMPLGVG
jgi:hypothetical protein